MRGPGRTPMRVLNEPAGFLGLSSLDLCIVGYLLVISHSALESIGAGFLSFIFAGLAGYLLVGIRLRFRNKIIRDFVFSKLGPKVIYDPES